MDSDPILEENENEVEDDILSENNSVKRKLIIE